MLWLLMIGAAAATPPLSSDLELQLSQGGGSLGVWGRVALQPEREGWLSVRPGLALGAYTGSEDWEEGATVTTGRVTDLHLQLHLTANMDPGEPGGLFFESGLYGGGYYLRSRGEWSHSELGLSQPYAADALVPDLGLRLVAGITPVEDLGIQLSVTDSLRRIGGEQGALAGLLSMDADAKLIIGIGVTYRRR